MQNLLYISFYETMKSFIWNSFELVEDCFLFKVLFVRSSSNRSAICFVHVSWKKKEEKKNTCICHLHDGEMNYGAGIRWPAISRAAVSSCKATCLDESTVKRSIIIYCDLNLNNFESEEGKVLTKFEDWLNFKKKKTVLHFKK